MCDRTLDGCGDGVAQGGGGGLSVVYHAPHETKVTDCPKRLNARGSKSGGLGLVGTGPHTGGDCRPARPSLRGTGPRSCAVRFQGRAD